MGDYGIKISLPGYNVENATLQQTAFSSKYPIFKVALAGALSLTIPAADGSGNPGSDSVSLAHGLGYIPMFRVYSQASFTGTDRQPLDFRIPHTPPGDIHIQGRCDATNLIIQGQNADATTAHTFIVYYYIFVDPGS